MYRKFILSLSGCILLLSLHTSAQDFVADTLIGCDSLTVRFTYNDGSYGATSWQWYFSNGDTSMRQDTFIVFHNPGLYSVMLVVNNTDTVRKVNYINVRTGPISNFDYNDSTTISTYEIRFIGAPQVYPGVKYVYDWNFGDATLFSDTLALALHKYEDAGTYSVGLRVRDDLGCEDVITKSIEVLDDFDVPNVFSPNGDGKNDAFIVRSNGVDVLTLRVYSRSGSLIYENSAKVIVWDGRSLNGIELKEGVYYYVVTSDAGTHEKAGTVHIYK